MLIPLLLLLPLILLIPLILLSPLTPLLLLILLILRTPSRQLGATWQVSLAWILVHLYADDELLQRARDEIATCPDLSDYSAISDLPFLNSCIDEAVRLHTMLPSNTVLRKTRTEISLGDDLIEKGSVLWLYPNAVHQDETCNRRTTASNSHTTTLHPAPSHTTRDASPCRDSTPLHQRPPLLTRPRPHPLHPADFPQPTSFCPMRLMSGNLERMGDEFELVTFGHGQKRCIGEKMARTMIIAYLGAVLPTVDADAPDQLPDDGFFDLIPASQLRLYNVRARGEPPPSEVGGQP